MDRIWAPWRIGYIKQTSSVSRSKGKKDCLLCHIINSPQSDKKNFVIYRSKHSISILNIYPYNNGHLMIVPNKHLKSLDKFNSQEILDIFNNINLMSKLLKKTLSPQGFNIGINIGKVSGAGIEQHIHIHIVPRWNGDTNFMPVIGNTKVISQSLRNLYKDLSGSLKYLIKC